MFVAAARRERPTQPSFVESLSSFKVNFSIYLILLIIPFFCAATMIVIKYACALMVEDKSAAFPLALQVYQNSSTGDAIASAIRKRTSLF